MVLYPECDYFENVVMMNTHQKAEIVKIVTDLKFAKSKRKGKIFGKK